MVGRERETAGRDGGLRFIFIPTYFLARHIAPTDVLPVIRSRPIKYGVYTVLEGNDRRPFGFLFSLDW